MPTAGHPMTHRSFWAVTSVLSVALVAGIWSVDYLPTHDGPQHILLGHIEAHFDDPDTSYGQYFELTPQWVSRGFPALFVPLLHLFSWRNALKLTLSVAVLLWSFGFLFVVLALNPVRRWLGWLGFATAFQWPLYMGFFSFYLASALGWAWLALALSRRRWEGLRLFALSALLLTQTFCHLFPALITGMILTLLTLVRTSQVGWRRAMSR